MKDSYLISYKLFCQRRNFSLEAFVRRNKELSFENVKNFFLEKDVEPPSEIEFLKIQKQIQLENVPKQEEAIKKEEPKSKKQSPRKRRRRKPKND